MNKPLQPVSDGGWGWLVLAGTFTGLLLISGMVFNVGIYVVEWQEYFSTGASEVSAVATALTFGPHLTGIFAGALCKRFGCRPVMVVGAVITTIATFLGSFSSELWHLTIYGVFAGIGTGISYIPSIVVTRFYFKKRIGFANGITYAGFGVGLLVMAPVTERLCAIYGWQGALLIHSALNANMLVCGILFRPSKLEQQMLEEYRSTTSRGAAIIMKKRENHLDVVDDDDDKDDDERTPSFCSKTLRKIDNVFALSSLLKNRLFVVFTLVSIFTFCGNVSTLVFTTPKLVFDLGFSKMTASLILSVYGICSVLAQTLHGFLLDFNLISVTNLYLLSVVMCGADPLFNPFVTSVEGQFVLIVIFGIGSGLMSPLTMLVCRQYVPLDIVSNGIGLVAAMGSIGVLMGTQLMGILYDATGSYDIPFYINGAVMWAAAISMAFITKWSCWKEKGVEPTIKASYSATGDGVVTDVPRDEPDESAQSGYQPVPTGFGPHDITDSDSESGV